MNIKKYLAIAIIAFLFFSCAKEDNARKKIAGEYSLYHYEVDYYNSDGITISSSLKKDLDGILNLKTQNSGANEWYNDCDYSLIEIPKGWFDNTIRTQHPSWHCDQGSMKVINFFREPNPGNVIYATYTITKNGRKKYIFSYIGMKNGVMDYEERLYLKEK